MMPNLPTEMDRGRKQPEAEVETSYAGGRGYDGVGADAFPSSSREAALRLKCGPVLLRICYLVLFGAYLLDLQGK